jgi:hypothetical protein
MASACKMAAGEVTTTATKLATTTAKVTSATTEMTSATEVAATTAEAATMSAPSTSAAVTEGHRAGGHHRSTEGNCREGRYQFPPHRSLLCF